MVSNYTEQLPEILKNHLMTFLTDRFTDLLKRRNKIYKRSDKRIRDIYALLLLLSRKLNMQFSLTSFNFYVPFPNQIKMFFESGKFS